MATVVPCQFEGTMGATEKAPDSDLPIPEHLKKRLAAYLQQQHPQGTTAEGEDARKDERIEQLEKEVDLLSKKASALEAQNILVPVQQLDLFARGTAWLCSIASLIVYWRLVWWAMNALPVLPNDIWLGNEIPPALLHPATWWVVRIAALLFPYLYNRWTHGSFHRRYVQNTSGETSVGMLATSWDTLGVGVLLLVSL